MAMTQQRIDEISAGYDLDCGGYSFELTTLEGVGEVLQWNDPDPDYVPWILEGDNVHPIKHLRYTREYYSLVCPVYMFAPGDYGATNWPTTGWVDDDGDTYTLVRHGVLYDTDRSCYCEEIERDSDGDGSCGRPGCEDGILESVGGSWALYAIEEAD